MLMTKEELLTKSDADLLDMVNKAAGHTGKDFQEFMECDFSYSFLTTTLKNRGYENGWHKVDGTAVATQAAEVILMKKSDAETVRQSYQIGKRVAAEWKEFNKNVPFKSVTLESAMQRFMSDVKSGKIRFELEI